MPSDIKNKTGSVVGSGHVPPDEVIFGRSPGMAEVRRRVEKVCGTNVPVLLCGDAGTGKEVIARWIHSRSGYKAGQFIKVNCAAIPGPLLESELFGYEKGAFTGAHVSKPGQVELAAKGTLFLDEIAELDMGLQSKLLHFVQDGSFSHLGGEEEQFVDTRIICATNRDLDTEIATGRFRADLYYRISVLQVRLPRLSERKEDVAVLADHFHALYQKQFAKECEPLGSKLLNHLETLAWPGNVRELSNCIARFVLIGADAFVPAALPQKCKVFSPGSAATNGNLPLKVIAKEAIREMERNLILETLRTHKWNRRKTAEALKISYRALIYKIREAGLGSRRIGIAPAVSGPSRAEPSVASSLVPPRPSPETSR